MINKYPVKIILDKKNNILESFDYYFNDGRSALEYGVNLYGLNNSKILVPEYICDEVIQKLNQLNMRVEYYDLNDMLIPDYNKLIKLIDNDVKSIMFINYFGLPINISENLKFAKQNNLIMIEDNAHGFSGSLKNRLLGNYGDIGFTSPRKNLNVMTGGLLYVKNKEFKKDINIKKKN